VHADRQFQDAGLAELYDHWSPAAGRADFAFYLPLILAG
jgi:hypothetical protein